LKQLGLAGALVHAFDDKPISAQPGNSLKSELADLKQQIEQARAAAAARRSKHAP
jgi:hypothetical protein